MNINQFRSSITGGISNYLNDTPDDYIKQIFDGKIGTIEINTSTSSNFEDSCVELDNPLVSDSTYYLDCKFKTEESSEQTFYLILYDSTGINESQFIESFSIPQGQEQMIDKDFVFTPFSNYDTIIFELVRKSVDYITPRTPIICYNELSLVRNIIDTKNLTQGKDLIKIGMQTRPFVDMCINGERIKVNRTGIFELRDPNVRITSFSSYERAVNKLTEEEKREGKKTEDDLFDKDKCSLLFKHQKERAIVQFSLDYCYEE